ncbi:hypothetical protein FGB62_10g37 [Gracilaria domingensis]|nr:hypothetical protein FGB62_10g37 [Gracilaria domingensis]
MEASLSTTANMVIGLTLNPVFYTRSTGDFVLSVTPVAAVMFDLENTDLDFDVRGLSFVTTIAGPLLGFTSSLTDGIKDIFDGRGVRTVIDNLEDSLLFDLGIPILSRVDALPRPARDLVFELLSDVGEKELEKEEEGYGSDFEQFLNSKIRDAIGADSSGEREFVVRGDILDLIGTVSIDDLFL